MADLAPADREILEGLHELVTARTMDEHMVAVERECRGRAIGCCACGLRQEAIRKRTPLSARKCMA